jgi:putative phage-type endonuclease
MIKFFEDALPQRSAEWFEWRSKRGMASEAACVMGESSYEPTTWLQLYNLKLDDRHQAPLTTPAMQWGIDHEPDARDWFVARHGIEILPCVVSDEFRSQWTDGAETIVSEFQLGASLDGESGDGTPVEIKCPFKGIDSDLWKQVEHLNPCVRGDELPRYIFWQCQQQMLVTSQTRMMLMFWCPQVDGEGDNYNKVFVVDADPEAQDELVNSWGEFLYRLHRRQEPDPAKGDRIVRARPLSDGGPPDKLGSRAFPYMLRGRDESEETYQWRVVEDRLAGLLEKKDRLYEEIDKEKSSLIEMSKVYKNKPTLAQSVGRHVSVIYTAAHERTASITKARKVEARWTVRRHPAGAKRNG